MRAKYMENVQGGMKIMKDIKESFDENNIMNPWKMGL